MSTQDEKGLITTMLNLVAHGSDTDENEISGLLEQQDPYIRKLARETLCHEHRVDDLVQLSRIKLWQAAKARRINNPKSYIRCIVKSAYVEMMRQQKFAAPLAMSEDGELLQGQAMVRLCEEMHDPLEVVECRERFRERLDMLVDAATALPLRQRRALICRLKDRVDDLNLLIEAFRERNLNIENEHWPADEADRHNLAASIAPANKKIKELMQKQPIP